MEDFRLLRFKNMPLCIEYQDGRRELISEKEILSIIKELGRIPDVEDMDYLYKNSCQISITSACNCRCLHCFAGDENGSMVGEFTLPEIEHILDECLSVGIKTIELTGGEPLMHPKFKEILRTIADRDMNLRAIYTNSMFVDKDLLSEFERLNLHPYFYISFDGIGTHDKFRGIDGMEAIVLDKLNLIHASGYSIRCNVNVNRITLPMLVDTARYLAKNFGAEIFLIRTSPSPRWEKAAPDAMLCYEEYYEACLGVVAADVSEKWNVPIRMLHIPTIPANRDMHEIFEIWKTKPKCRQNSCLMVHCPKANNMLYIAHDGRVLPCDGYEGASVVRNFLVGDDINILKRSLRDILCDSEYSHIHDVLVSDLVMAEPECASCEWLSICKGGCRLLSLYGQDDNSLTHKSYSNCLFFKGGYADRLMELFT